MSKKLDKALDLVPINKEDSNFVLIPTDDQHDILQEKSEEEQIKDDFEIGRESFHDLIEKGHEAIDEMIEIAKQSQHPAAYATLNQMLKNMAEMHKDLLTIHGKKQKLLSGKENREKRNESTHNTQQNIFVGTTAELAKLLRGERGDSDGDEL